MKALKVEDYAIVPNVDKDLYNPMTGEYLYVEPADGTWDCDEYDVWLIPLGKPSELSSDAEEDGMDVEEWVENYFEENNHADGASVGLIKDGVLLDGTLSMLLCKPGWMPAEPQYLTSVGGIYFEDDHFLLAYEDANERNGRYLCNEYDPTTDSAGNPAWIRHDTSSASEEYLQTLILAPEDVAHDILEVETKRTMTFLEKTEEIAR